MLGQQGLSLKEILETIGNRDFASGSKDILGPLNILLEEFFVGISHDRNMIRMVQEHADTDFKKSGIKNYFEAHGVQQEHSFKEFYG